MEVQQLISFLAFWVSLALLLRGLFLGAKLILKSPGMDRKSAISGMVVCLVLVAVIGLAVPTFRTSPGLAIPIIWPVLAVQLWLVAICLIGAIVTFAKAILHGASGSEKGKFFPVFSVLQWIVGAAVFWILPRANKEPIRFLTGKIELSTPAIFALLSLTVVAILAMVAGQKSALLRERIAGFAVQLSLLIGVFVFGVPFLFLFITSFKEDRDMSSPNGIVWVPRVIQTKAVMDDENPYYETTYKGVTVQANLNKVNSDGTLILTIEHPVFYGGYSFETKPSEAKKIPREMPMVSGTLNGTKIEGVTFRRLANGDRDVLIESPADLKGQRHVFKPTEIEDVRPVSLRWRNYVEALEYLPPEAHYGLLYLKNTLWLVVMNVLGALVSSSLVAYGFARLKFPGKETLFKIMLSTMMLPAAITLLPQFLIFREFGWVNTLKPLWVTAWFGSAFNIFLMRQFFEQVPFELEDAAKIDGCSYLKSLWAVMLPQVKPALAVIAVTTFMAAWNNFMGPLVYSSSPETLPISYAVQLFNGERNGDPGLLMAFVTMSLVPVIALFVFAQRFFIEGVTLSGLGGR